MHNKHLKYLIIWSSILCALFLFSGTALGQTSFIEMTAYPKNDETGRYEIPADGVSVSRITATLTNSFGELVRPYTQATFTTTHGFFANGQQTITETTKAPWDETTGRWDLDKYNGQIIISLTSVLEPGIAVVTCSVRVSQHTTVSNSVKVFIGDTEDIEDYRTNLFAYPSRIPPDGISSGNILAIVTEIPVGEEPDIGRAAPAGTILEFSTNLGLFANGEQEITTYLPDSSGLAIVQLYSGIIPGIAKVECRVAGGLSVSSIDVIMQYPSADVIVHHEIEPNNRPEDANTVDARTIYNGSLHNPYDEDFFAFTLDNSQKVEIYFLATNTNCAPLACGTFNIDVRNGDNQTLASYRHFVTVDPLAIQQWGVYLNPGTYYISVYYPRIFTPLLSQYTSSPYFLFLDY